MSQFCKIPQIVQSCVCIKMRLSVGETIISVIKFVVQFYENLPFICFDVKDSLGGNAHSCMIVNISPEECYYMDTASTLKLARKSKKIVNTVTVNEVIGELIVH